MTIPLLVCIVDNVCVYGIPLGQPDNGPLLHLFYIRITHLLFRMMVLFIIIVFDIVTDDDCELLLIIPWYCICDDVLSSVILLMTMTYCVLFLVENDVTW